MSKNQSVVARLAAAHKPSLLALAVIAANGALLPAVGYAEES